MKGTAKSKVVTSGRLTGRVKVQPARRQVTSNPGPAARSEPAYSLYSTDSEDQVTSLHKGLDRCAALLGGILRAEEAATPSLPRAAKGGAAKSRPSTSLKKKSIKKLPTKTDQKSCQAVQRGARSTTSKTTHQSPVPAAHSGVKLHPPQKQPLQSRFTPSRCQKLQQLFPTTPPPQPQTSNTPTQPTPSPPRTDRRSAADAPHTRCEAECDRAEEDCGPARDVNTQSAATDTHSAVRNTHVHTCAAKMSNVQLEPGQVEGVPQDTHIGEDSGAKTEVNVKEVQYLLGELKALIGGQGSVAERLLSCLEQNVSSLLRDRGGGSSIKPDPDLSSLHCQNTQLCRRVRILEQQLKEREEAERQQNICNSEVLSLQEELTSAQSRLQQLQGDLTELRKALRDTQSQLRDREAENALIKTDLEAARSRLLDSEREKDELASLAQQRLEELGHLNRPLQSHDSSVCAPVVGSPASDPLLLTRQHFELYQHGQDPAEPPSGRIAQYLMSLGRLEPTRESDGNPPERKKPTSVQLRDTSLHPGDRPASHQNSQLNRSSGRRPEQQHEALSTSTLSRCDVESVWSEWSARSVSTFDPREEAAFRDGLSALDASIASLQKTIELDLGR